MVTLLEFDSLIAQSPLRYTGFPKWKRLFGSRIVILTARFCSKLSLEVLGVLDIPLS